MAMATMMMTTSRTATTATPITTPTDELDPPPETEVGLPSVGVGTAGIKRNLLYIGHPTIDSYS